jgi:nitrate/nitrite transporter NarK
LLTIVTVFKAVNWSAAQTALAIAEAAAVAGLITALVAHLAPGTSKEPVALAATLTATVSATLALGSGFGWWSFTEQQTSAVAGVVTAVLGVGGALFARHHVTARSDSSTN